MTSILTRRRALWVATESTYGTDPDSDGSDYLAIPALEIGDIQDEKTLYDTRYGTGRPYRTAPLAGPDGWSFTFSTPVIGLLTAAGDGTNASAKTDDWLDLLLTHIFGTQATTVGEGVASVGGATAVTLDTDIYNVQELIPTYEASVPSAAAARTQWNLITVDPADASYTIAPGWAANPTGAAVVYGVKNYQFDDEGGASLSFAYLEDATQRTLTGGRITSAKIVGEAGGLVTLEISVSGDAIATGAKASLPAALTAPAITPITGTLSPVWFNGTSYATQKFEIDFGMTATVMGSTAGVNGRGDWTNTAWAPTVTIEPLWADALITLKRAATTGRLLVQIGAGVLSSSILNTLAIHAEEAVAEEVTRMDDAGRARLAIRFAVTDKRYFSAGVNARFFQLARA